MELESYRSFGVFSHELCNRIPAAERWKKGLLRDLWEEYVSGTRQFALLKKKFVSIVHETAVDVLRGDFALRKKYETHGELVVLPKKNDDCRLLERAAFPLEQPNRSGARAVEKALGLIGSGVLFSAPLIDGRPAGYEHKARSVSWEYPGLPVLSFKAERTLMLDSNIKIPQSFDVEQGSAVVRYEWEPQGPRATLLRNKKRA